MHLLMISLDSSLLGDPHGNTVTRHIAYAERVGQMSVIVYNPASAPKIVTHLSDRLAVYPTNVPTPYLFPFAAFWCGVRVHRQQRADLITTQDPFATGLIGLLLKWALRIPLNVQSHSHFFENPDWVAERPLRNRALLTIGKFVVKRADTLRVLSEREKMICVRLGVAPRRIIVLTAPTDVGSFAPPVAPERARDGRPRARPATLRRAAGRSRRSASARSDRAARRLRPGSTRSASFRSSGSAAGPTSSGTRGCRPRGRCRRGRPGQEGLRNDNYRDDDNYEGEAVNHGGRWGDLVVVDG